MARGGAALSRKRTAARTANTRRAAVLQTLAPTWRTGPETLQCVRGTEMRDKILSLVGVVPVVCLAASACGLSHWT